MCTIYEYVYRHLGLLVLEVRVLSSIRVGNQSGNRYLGTKFRTSTFIIPTTQVLRTVILVLVHKVLLLLYRVSYDVYT